MILYYLVNTKFLFFIELLPGLEINFFTVLLKDTAIIFQNIITRSVKEYTFNRIFHKRISHDIM